jgi:hypothetical protein
MTLPTGLPLFTGRTTIVTTSPGLKELLLQPRLIMSGGLLVSVTHRTVLPSSPFTSNCRKQCGLAQNHSTTVPLKVSLFAGSFSNAATPWWAAAGIEALNPAKDDNQCLKNSRSHGVNLQSGLLPRELRSTNISLPRNCNDNARHSP